MIKNNVTNPWLGKIVVKNSNIYLIENNIGLQGELSAYKIGILFQAIESSIDNELLSYVSEKISEKDIELFNFDNNLFWNKDHYYAHPFSDDYIWHENYFLQNSSLFAHKDNYVFNMTIKDGVLEDIKLNSQPNNNEQLIHNKMLEISSQPSNGHFHDTEALFYKTIVFNNSFTQKMTLDKLKLKTIMQEDEFARIANVLDMIEASMRSSDFINVLRCLRILRKSVNEHIFDDYFIPIYSATHFAIKEMDDLKQLASDVEVNKQLDKFIVEVSSNISLIADYFEIPNTDKLMEHFSNVYQEYYKGPVYFSFTAFEDILTPKINMNPDNDAVIKFIQQRLLQSETKINDWNKASTPTKTSIHKNNHHLENFHGWYINETEIDTIYKMTAIFLEPLFLYDKFKKNEQ